MNKAPISKKYPDGFSVVPIEDITTADFTDALKGAFRRPTYLVERGSHAVFVGIHAIVHVASPMGQTAGDHLTVRRTILPRQEASLTLLELGCKERELEHTPSSPQGWYHQSSHYGNFRCDDGSYVPFILACQLHGSHSC